VIIDERDHHFGRRSSSIQRWNAAAEALFAHSAPEAIGGNLDLIIPERLRAAHWRGFKAAITNGTTRLHGRVTLTRAVHKTARKLYVEMTFALVRDNQGVVCGSVAITRDVTARVEQERSAERRGGDV
jgi:PAS domain S-box-containing protein